MIHTWEGSDEWINKSYKKYGGMKGFNDYGRVGCRMKNKLQALWREYYIEGEEDVEEIETSLIVPYEVLKVSGHVDRLTNEVVIDEAGEMHKAREVVKEYMKRNGLNHAVIQVEGWDRRRLEMEINKHKMMRGEQGNKLGMVKVVTRNLMYPVAVTEAREKRESDEGAVDFLRPELAQGIIMSSEMNKKIVPYGIAEIGKIYRREVAVKEYVRMREMTQGTLEYFIDTESTEHDRYEEIKQDEIVILTAQQQIKKEKARVITIEGAKDEGIISNETMGYYIAKMNRFAMKIGLADHKIRTREILSYELSHNATRSWRVEAYVNGKWEITCMTVTNRGTYDMEAHKMKIRRKRKEPKIEKKLKINLNRAKIRQRYKELTNKIIRYFKRMTQTELKDGRENWFKNRDTMYVYINEFMCVITKEMIEIEEYEERREYEEYSPQVIESICEIDKTIYAIYEHNYMNVAGNRNILSLPRKLVPYDVALIVKEDDGEKQEIINIMNTIIRKIRKAGYSVYLDDKEEEELKKENRADERGVRYIARVNSLYGELIVRERETMKEKKMKVEELIKKLK